VNSDAQRSPSSGAESRAQAARIVHLVVHHGRHLEAALAGVGAQEKAFVYDLVSTTIRYHPALDRLWAIARSGASEEDDPRLRSLGLVGLAQILHTHIPDHAAVAATVEASRLLGLGRAAPLLNAVLRRVTRERRDLDDRARNDLELRYAHPAWWITRLQQDWPDDWPRLLEAGLERAPMTLRVNIRRAHVADCRAALEAQGVDSRPTHRASYGLILATPRPTASLDVYTRGWASVQDEAAQLAVPLLAPEPGNHILDACCAPGNKLAQIRETAPEHCRLVGFDISARRLEYTRRELERLGHTGVELRHADASQPEALPPQEQFDRILLDTPCTASGTVRRHPDVKIHRHPEDIRARATLAFQLLENLWGHLRPGGRLLFTSCSVFREETDEVVRTFLNNHMKEGMLLDPAVPWGRHEPTGIHNLTGEEGMDGFFYAVFLKTASTDRIHNNPGGPEQGCNPHAPDRYSQDRRPQNTPDPISHSS
jgi:16S rRNA (cytosine967-C5)-methyltransferase